jgi:hypothetical protein
MELIDFLDTIKIQKGWSEETLLEQMALFIEMQDLSEELEEHLLSEASEIITEDRQVYDDEDEE